MKRYMTLPIVLIGVLTLAACGAPSSNEISDLSLAQTKSPVQLLRNEAASRVSAVADATLLTTNDVSVACRSADEDPKGLERQWQSAVTFAVPSDSLSVAHDLVDSFVGEEWSARSSVDDATAYRVVLTKATSTASIHLDADESQLEVWTNGPCVTTAGADSVEVTSLESSE